MEYNNEGVGTMTYMVRVPTRCRVDSSGAYWGLAMTWDTVEVSHTSAFDFEIPQTVTYALQFLAIFKNGFHDCNRQALRCWGKKAKKIISTPP